MEKAREILISRSQKYEKTHYEDMHSIVMGIRQQTYSEYERGISHMHIEEFVSLARIFDVSVDFITGVSNVRRAFPKF